MTLIVGTRCKDGIVLVGDRKVTGGVKPYTDKIKRLGALNTIIFTAAGIESLFEEFLQEVSRVVLHEANIISQHNKEHPDDPRLPYSTTNFKHDCSRVLRTMKEVYSELEEHVNLENALQVLFVVPEVSQDDNKPVYRLYGMNMLGCYPFPIDEGKIQQIGQIGIANVFLKSLDGKEYTMRDVARVSSFAIKYVEQENLSDGIGVGTDNEPQIWFMEDGKEPREIRDAELHDILENVDGEVLNIRKKIGTLSRFLRS